jgi:CubicO group peptidase (beta-lactamase class C family)
MRFLFLLFFLPYFSFSQDSKQLDQLLTKLVAESHAAGASVFVATKGEIVLNKGYGFADLAFGVAAGQDTKYFMIAPGTLMLATAVMQLVDSKQLKLDDRISTYLPDFPLQGKNVTIKHLITSTSGIPDYHYLGDPQLGLRFQPRTLDEVINLFKGQPFVIEPGQKFDWSISNFALLVAIVEKITGMSYEQYVTEKFIQPLSLKQTEYITDDKIINQFAPGYHVVEGEFVPARESSIKYDPSLRFATTTGDIYKLWNGIRSGKVVSTKSFELMTSREEAIKNHSERYGYGINLLKDSMSEFLMGGGALDGYSNYLYYNPAKDMTIIVLSNTSNMAAREIGRRVAAYLLGQPVPQFTKRKPTAFANYTVPEEMIQQITGTYVVNRTRKDASTTSHTLYKRTLRIFVQNGNLMIQRFGELPTPLLLQPDGTFREKNNSSQITFKTMDTTTITFGSSDGPGYDTGSKIGNADAATFRAKAFENMK